MPDWEAVYSTAGDVALRWLDFLNQYGGEMQKPDLRWHKYYSRVIGFFLAGGGAGLVLDELINGPFHVTYHDHEAWGLVAVIVGAVLISKYPKGKDL